MNFEQLKILHHIIEDGGLNAAARRLNKTQPALSIAIKKLESSVGFDILSRDHYRLELTERGKTFYRQSKMLLQDMERLKTLSQQLSKGEEPSFNITFEQSSPPDHYMPVFKQSLQRFKATQFKFSSGYRFSALQHVSEGLADLGIGPWFHVMHSTGDFETLPLGEFHLLVVASPNLISYKKPITLQSLNDYPLITTQESGLNFDNESLSSFKSASQQCRVNSPETSRQMLINEMGWGMIPKHYVEDDLKQERLKPLKILDFESEFTGEIRAFRQRNKTHGPVAEFIWQSLKENCS
ncbi:LysR family transcriptional regulator [Pleionea sediminis]|uniref:LysR family transcriptional regulator n=1 Tax=Pleionea sediminis TaxID=2569479 RepID=UPI0011868E18|nr:LysR family transcriptional regulator [Pleionea sediminis]